VAIIAVLAIVAMVALARGEPQHGSPKVASSSTGLLLG
jgi:hypothetical protein